MFKILFELITDPLGLPIASHFEYIILLIIGFIAYKFAYMIVNKLYQNSMIESKASGKIAHWSIRILVFLCLYILTRWIITLVNWIDNNRNLALCIVIAAFILSVFILVLIKNAKNPKSSNKNYL